MLLTRPDMWQSLQFELGSGEDTSGCLTALKWLQKRCNATRELENKASRYTDDCMAKGLHRGVSVHFPEPASAACRRH